MDVKEVKPTKVHVKLTTGEDFFGEVFLHPDQRLQDLVNDERQFLPVKQYKTNRGRGNEDVRVDTVVNKSILAILEER